MGRPPVVTLTSDFGTADGYVGAMKGVILGIAPDARLVDISHQIVPQGVREAAFVLYTAYSYFPEHTVHVAVVDPGVGGERRAIALGTSVGSFVGPDNGIFTYVMAREKVDLLIVIEEHSYMLDAISNTFHGRDVFAPAAAHIAAGLSLKELGSPIDDPVEIDLPSLQVDPSSVKGEVMHVDRFGNAITSIGRLAWIESNRLQLAPAFAQPGPEVRVSISASTAVTTVAGREIPGILRTYSEAQVEQVAVLVGSSGHLEIAIREGNSAQELGLGVGTPVVVSW